MSSGLTLRWPGARRAAIVGVVFVAGAAAVVGYPSLLRDTGAEASENAALTFSDREIAGGNGIVVDQAAVYAARALIPEKAAYHVAVGAEYAGADLTRDHVASYFRYFLMPRRPAEGAEWVVCYGCDLGEYGEAAEVLWRTDGDISIVRVGS